MEYMFEKTPMNYEDYASGRVLYNARGATAFPVRLASEFAQRGFRLLEERGCAGPYTLYDPCCGGGYLLTVIGLMHGRRLRAVYGSDIDKDKLAVAASNLSLLTVEGMERRAAQLRELDAAYGKPSHREALVSLAKLDGARRHAAIEKTELFAADATDPGALAGKAAGVNLVMADLPYGELAEWRTDTADPAEALLSNLLNVLDPAHSIVIIVADKQQKLRHDRYRRLQHIKVGKRQAALFEPIVER